MILLVTSLAPIASAQSTQQRLDRARVARQEVQVRLDQAAIRLNEIEVEMARLEAQRDELQQRIDGLEREYAAAADRIALRIRDIYKGSRLDPAALFVAGKGVDAALTRATVGRLLIRGDEAAAETATNARVEVAAAKLQLEAANADLIATVEERRQLVEQLTADLEEAQELESELQAQRNVEIEEERRRAAAEAARREAERQAAIRAAGGYACPVAQPNSFTNTWGAPRSGGRRHRGTDILAPRGLPVYAIVGGTLDIRSPGRNAGLWAILRGVDGDQYWYMHLDGWAVGDGARVTAGQLIGFNGDTGNARGTTPHVHFEQHPGGGGAVNPYFLLKKLCG